jgi:hypothetical protein
MIRISVRDKHTQEWVNERLREGEDYGGYSYYNDLSKEKILKDVYKTIQNAANTALKNFKKSIKLYTDIEVKYSKTIQNNAVAMYIGDTSTNVPIILIGVDSILKYLKKDAKKWAMDDSPEGIHRHIEQELYPSIMISLYHELGHAMVDEIKQWFRAENNEDLEYDNEESLVEDFAREFYDDGSITPDMQKVIKEIKIIRKGGRIEV